MDYLNAREVSSGFRREKKHGGKKKNFLVRASATAWLRLGHGVRIPGTTMAMNRPYRRHRCSMILLVKCCALTLLVDG